MSPITLLWCIRTASRGSLRSLSIDNPLRVVAEVSQGILVTSGSYLMFAMLPSVMIALPMEVPWSIQPRASSLASFCIHSSTSAQSGSSGRGSRLSSNFSCLTMSRALCCCLWTSLTSRFLALILSAVSFSTASIFSIIESLSLTSFFSSSLSLSDSLFWIFSTLDS